MPIVNPSIQLYGNMKKLVTKLRNQSLDKPDNNKNNGIMLRRSASMNTDNAPKELEENIKIARIMMKLEDERNGRA
tara:strand:- start:249 stop:476 length:228 start_codon:yes stop_codon:yes gene_type:complete